MAQLKRFKEYSYNELAELISNHKNFKYFNTLGLYRSLLENEKLALNEKVQLREIAHIHFKKTFDFLQLKDPETYFKITTLGETYTEGDERNIWQQIKANQEKILKEKRIKHRNFGVYSKHICGHDWCPYNGLMIQQGSSLSYGEMHFKSDKNRNNQKQKSLNLKKEQKQKPIIED